jgi:hypothetical protein
MKKLLIIFLLFPLTMVYAQNQPINVIPQPAEMQKTPGSYTLVQNSTISFDSQEGSKVTEMLAQKLNQATGFAIKPQQGGGGSIKLNLNKAEVGNLEKRDILSHPLPRVLS